MLELGILCFTSVASILLGLIVYIKNPTGLVNRLFLLLAASIVLWSVINYFSLHPYGSNQLFWIRGVLTASVGLNISIFLTLLAFPRGYLSAEHKRQAKIATAISVTVAVLTLTPFVFRSLKYNNGSASPVPSTGIVIFLIYTVVLLGYSILLTIKKYYHAQGVAKEQLKTILFGIIGTFGTLVVVNFILVVAFNITFFVPFGPSLTLIFSSSLAYAIVRHKLFDIRAAVARSLGYVLIIGSIAGVYSVGLFGIIDVIFAGQHEEKLRQILSVFIMAPLAIGFQSTKGFFDRITTRLFYKDSYDSQEVLKAMGNIVVAEINLDKILGDTRAVLSNAMKASFIEFVLFRDGKPYMGSKKLSAIQANIISTASHISDQHNDLLMTDEMAANNPLHHMFSEDGIALSLRLKTQQQLVGFVLFGSKRSGDIYRNQDRRLLTIVANELAIATQNALRFEEITAFNRTLQERINDATRKLRTTNAKLQALDETKDDFISMASHQLRTPLTSVKGYLSLVLEGDTGKITGTQRKMLGQAFTSSQRMVYLIADLLNVSRLKTGKFLIEAVPINLAVLVSDEIAQLKETAASRSLSLVFNKPDDFPEIMLDETKTRQVIMNFVDNAIYYTPAGGVITIELLNKPASVELRVVDNGIGVPRSEQHHLFTKFYRAGNARKARPDGTGLGLFMAKKVVVAQGGAIIFESAENKGSVFGFTFSKTKLAVGGNANAPIAEPVKMHA
jgi:signal transduction histidine kinase